MRSLIVTEFMSLDGVVQAPGDPQEDTEGGFVHGGWQRPYFDDVFMREAAGGMAQAIDAGIPKLRVSGTEPHAFRVWAT